MNKKVKCISILTSLCLILMSVILANSFITSSKRANISCFYPAMNISSLTTESDLIIKGTVEKVLPSDFYKVTKYAIGEEEEKKMREICRETKEAFVVLPSEDHVEEFLNQNRGWVYTDKVIKVDEYLKNDLGEQKIRVRELGGDYKGQQKIVEGEIPLKEGDRVILFLIKGKQGTYGIMGGPQGKYFISGDSAQNPDGENINIADLKDLL